MPTTDDHGDRDIDVEEGHALYELMSTLRAVRRLRPDPIPDDVLARVLQAACWAPTGGNTQPWRVLVVTDPELKEGVAEIYRPEWERYVDFARKRSVAAGLDAAARAAQERTIAAGDHLAAHMGEAPVLLLFVADPARMAITDAKLDRVSMVGGASVDTAVQNAMLACRAEGLGCTLTTLHCHREDEVKALLDIPDSWATVALVPIGYPKGRGHGPITRQGPETMAYSDRFGRSWPVS
ncbi:MAG: nitroreductase family protein [Acidimicrobiia bacterium]|nr:nitroreductase family protein [Acidimicrobiia bacterium]